MIGSKQMNRSKQLICHFDLSSDQSQEQNNANHKQQQYQKDAINKQENKSQQQKAQLQSPSSISLRSSHISKLTFMESSGSEDSKEEQQTLQIPKKKENHNKFDSPIIKGLNHTRKNVSEIKFSQQQSTKNKQYFLETTPNRSSYQEGNKIRINHSQLRRKRFFNQDNGKMESARLINNFTEDKQIDYNSFEKVELVKNNFKRNPNQMPKTYFQKNSFQEQISSPFENEKKLKNVFSNEDIQENGIKQRNPEELISPGQKSNFSLENNQDRSSENKQQNEFQNSNSSRQNRNRSQNIDNHSSEDPQTGSQNQDKYKKNPIDTKNKIPTQEQRFALILPSQSLLKSQKAFSQLISSTSNYTNIFEFIMNPIPPQTRMQFQIVRNKGILQTTYEFWLVIQNNQKGKFKNKLMKTTSNSINIESTVFYLTLCINDLVPMNLATLSSDLKRQQFNCYTNEKNDSRIMATASSKISINTHQRIELYTPNLDGQSGHEKFIPLYKNSVSNNLRKLSTMKYTCDQITRYYSVQIQPRVWDVISSRFFIKKSKRNSLVIDNEKVVKILMGKIEDNKYTLLSLSGISPLQLFTFAITNLIK